ncbi:hypothetical protein IT570_07610 [Candidatus Sumerlaeota bacterium]|nr:hypothetical protein [Candidatus Sumerlaeota bacterium]
MIAHLDAVIEESRAGVVAIHHKKIQGKLGQVIHAVTMQAHTRQFFANTSTEGRLISQRPDSER